MLRRVEDDERFLHSIVFSDESTFHVTDSINTRNYRILGSENSHASLEQVYDNPNIKFFASSVKRKYFFFMRVTITNISCLYILQQCLNFQLEDDQEGHIQFQQDGAPSHFLGEVLESLNNRRWIGRATPIAWPAKN
ncbi:hypothetical protein PR048_008357, partial [Dryococelus australis]